MTLKVVILMATGHTDCEKTIGRQREGEGIPEAKTRRDT